MLIQFMRGGGCGQEIVVETGRIVGCSFAGFWQGRVQTWIELDNGDRIRVFGDMGVLAEQINGANAWERGSPIPGGGPACAKSPTRS